MKLKPKIVFIFAVMFFSIIALEFFSGEFYFEKFFRIQKQKQLMDVNFINSHGEIDTKKLKHFQNITDSVVLIVKNNQIINIHNFDYFSIETREGKKTVLLNAFLNNLYSDNRFYLVDKEPVRLVGIDILAGKYYLPISIRCADRVYEDYKFSTMKGLKTCSVTGNVSATSDSDYFSPQASTLVESFSKLSDLKKEIHLFVNSSGQEVEIIKKEIDGYKIFVFYSYQNLSSVFPTLRVYFYFKAILLLLLTLAIGRFFDYFLVNPIVHLSKVTERISKLNFKNDIIYHKNDEIGELYFKIDEMAYRLEDVIKLYRDEAEKNIIKKEELEEKIMSFMHEIKTPLSLIMGFTELMQEKYKDDEDFNIIISEAKRLLRLSEETLLLENNSTVKENIILNRFDIIPVIKLGLHIYQKELSDKKIIFNDNREIFVTGDREKIEQVIFNLLKNGYYYAKNEIVITVDEIPGNKVCISIANDGESIPESDFNKIWNKFYTTSNNYQRGLGLYIVSNILKAHKSKYGVINLENCVKFYFTLERDEDMKKSGV